MIVPLRRVLNVRRLCVGTLPRRDRGEVCRVAGSRPMNDISLDQSWTYYTSI